MMASPNRGSNSSNTNDETDETQEASDDNNERSRDAVAVLALAAPASVTVTPPSTDQSGTSATTASLNDDDDDDKNNKKSSNRNQPNKHRSFDENFAALVCWKKKYGHTLVPVNCEEDPPLGRWCANLRKTKETLTPERLARLEYMGFTFVNPKQALEEKNWNDNFEQLRAFYLSHDDDDNNSSLNNNYINNNNSDRLPGGNGTLGPVLNRWVSRQRRNRKNGILSEERRLKLESIGFKWQVNELKNHKDYTKNDLQWINMHNQLVQYQRVHKDCNVPFGKPEYAQLAKWVARQRELYGQNRLLEDRKQLLNSVGFCWSVDELHWKKNFQNFRGHVLKHQSLETVQQLNPAIGRWWYSQRVRVANGQMPADRLQLLDALGIRFDGLKAFLAPNSMVEQQQQNTANHIDGNQNNHRGLLTERQKQTFNFKVDMFPPVGTKIRKKRFMEGWCNGQVVSLTQELDGSRALVRYDDTGDEEYMSDEEFRICAIAYQLQMPKNPFLVAAGGGSDGTAAAKKSAPNKKRLIGRADPSSKKAKTSTAVFI